MATKPNTERKGMTMNFKILGIVLAILLAVGGYLLYAQLGTGQRTAQAPASTPAVSGAPAPTASGMPAISITPEVNDLGDVSMSKGTVSTLFTIKNSGSGDLVIRDMETSCMCTEAAIAMGDQEGPRFGMRGMSSPPPADWSATIKPGQEVPLKVYYDPTVHGELHGPVTRVVRVYSNDPNRSYVDVKIELNQVH